MTAGEERSAMGTFFETSLDAPDAVAVARACESLSAGDAVVFPTDTVYGIGVAVRGDSDPSLLFEIKQRDRSKAIPWLAPDVDCLQAYGRDLRGYCLELAREFWPGPLTLVVEAGDAVPEAFRGEGGTIALRVPDSPVALAIMRSLGSPVATTSANVSGMEAVNDSGLLDSRITSLVPVVVDGGAIAGGLPSTVVSCTGAQPVVLREGAVSCEQVMGFAV